MTTPTPRKILTVFTVFLLTAAFLHSGDAEARRRGRKPRYQRPNNSTQCSNYSWKPSAKEIPQGASFENHGRIPFMTQKVHDYLSALNDRKCKLRINSTYRDCAINRHYGGAQKSLHLCGAGADTSGNCTKKVAASVCQSLGMRYIEEGSGRFPHCQMSQKKGDWYLCNKIPHD